MSVDAAPAPTTPTTTQVVVPMCTSPVTPLSLTLPTATPMAHQGNGDTRGGDSKGQIKGSGEVKVPGGEALLAAAESHLAATARGTGLQHQGGGNPVGTITVMPITPMVPHTTSGTAGVNVPTGLNTKLNSHNNHHGMPQLMDTSNATANSGTTEGGTASLPTNRHDMFNAFQTWALQNYGDSGKTKTVTRNKYDRIVRTLNGKEQATTENSKFRFWVKAKGFRLGPSPAEEAAGTEDQVLYVPTRVTSTVPCTLLAKAAKLVVLSTI